MNGDTKLWLWKNGDHFFAFEHLYPCFTPGGDPMTLGEPAGFALFKRSFDRTSLAALHPQPAPAVVAHESPNLSDNAACLPSVSHKPAPAVAVEAVSEQHAACATAHRWLFAHEWRRQGDYFVKIGHCETMSVEVVALIVGAALAARSAPAVAEKVPLTEAVGCKEQCWACAESGIGCNLLNDGRPAPAVAEKSLTDEDVQWIVNDNAELGVKIGNQFFFLYKGYSLVYGSDVTLNREDGIAVHDDGTPMHWRPVFKREFGECCHPINYKDPNYIGTVSLDDSDEWEQLPAPPTVGSATEGKANG